MENNNIIVYSSTYDKYYNELFKSTFNDIKVDYYKIGYLKALHNILFLNDWDKLPIQFNKIIISTINKYIKECEECEFIIYE